MFGGYTTDAMSSGAQWGMGGGEDRKHESYLVYELFHPASVGVFTFRCCREGYGKIELLLRGNFDVIKKVCEIRRRLKIYLPVVRIHVLA